MTEIEEHVREVLSTAREEGRREIDRSILANAIGVIDKERERANAAEKKLEALVEAVDGFVTIDDTTGVSWTDSNPDSRGDLAAALRDARDKS